MSVDLRAIRWIDYNHAPNELGQGAGYLHMVYSFTTAGAIPELYAEVGGGRGGGQHTNAFVAGSFPTDFRAAVITVKVKGSVTNTNGRHIRADFLSENDDLLLKMDGFSIRCRAGVY